MKLQLRVIYDTNGNWTLQDLENQEVWELGDTPGTDATPTRTIDLEILLPEIEPPTAVINVSASGDKATVTIS